MSNITLKDPKAIDLLARIQQVKEYTAVLQQLWLVLEICKGGCVPSSAQFALWLSAHSVEVVEAGIQATAVWLSKLRTGNASQQVVENRAEAVDNAKETITHDQKVRYASGVMNKMVQP
jgi:hypothetical protein